MNRQACLFSCERNPQLVSFFCEEKAETGSTSFSTKTQGTGSAVMNLETRGSTAQTINLASVNSGSTAQCQRELDPSPCKAADLRDPRRESAGSTAF